MRLHALPIALLLLAIGLAGCSGSGRLRYETPEEAFEKGTAFYERGKYDRAIEYFQGSFDFGRTHALAADAQLYLARAYRANKEYLLAANEYTRFMEIYRSDPRVPDAEFERALTYYERSPAFSLDQTDSQRAVEQFQLFINRFPGSDKVVDAEAKIMELREKMAHKQYETAKLYERRELFQAAALSYEAVFDRFFDTVWADDALLGAMKAYIAFSDRSIAARQPERLQKAIDNYDRLIQLFPNSDLLKEAEAVYTTAADKQNRLISEAQR
jgi:outer membrane protein assembly factor BamD